MYDVIIVGAGPSGATLARLIGNNKRVLIIERRDLTRNYNKGEFEKCCGGLVAPDAQKMLAELGLGIPINVLDGPQLFTVRTIDEKRHIERYYQRHYINVDREKFDRWMFSQIPSQVDICCGALLKNFEDLGDKVRVIYVKDGEKKEVTGRLLVGADGGFSKIRRLLFPESPMPQRYIAIQEYYRVFQLVPYYGSIFDKDITDFYSWTIPKDGILILGSALDPDDNPIEKFEELKRRLQKKGFKFGHCIKRNGSYLLRPRKTGQILLGKGNIILIGEAAGWISPSSAEGLSYGIKSALYLSEAIEKNLSNAVLNYRRNSRKLFMNIRWKNLKSFLMYNDTTRFLIMKSGIFTMGSIKEKLLETGVL